MFGFFGQPNPARVAEKQLNKAKLHLLEVQEARENLIAQENALMERIARLEKLAAPAVYGAKQANATKTYPPVQEVAV